MQTSLEQFTTSHLKPQFLFLHDILHLYSYMILRLLLSASNSYHLINPSDYYYHIYTQLKRSDLASEKNISMSDLFS